MGKEALHPFLQKALNEALHPVVTFSSAGDLSLLEPADTAPERLQQLQVAADELVTNAFEKPGVAKIAVSINENNGLYELTVTDDAPPLNAQAADELLKNLNSHESFTDKQYKKSVKEGFGTGIRLARAAFEQCRGSLVYHEVDGRIVAVAQFTREGIENPLPVRAELNPVCLISG